MADKSKTIKNASDKELEALIVRLRKEYELQSLVGDLKRRSSSNNFLSYDRPEVSTEEPIESLYHYGIPGMRWGRRKGFTTKRQLEYDKKDLDRLNKGGHISIGFGKKRQAAYDKRDRETIERSIEKNTNKINKVSDKKKMEEALNSADHKKKVGMKKKKISQMSNKELKELNERLQLEKQYKDLTKAEISAGRKFAQDLLRDAGKEVAKEIIKDMLKKGIKSAVKR